MLSLFRRASTLPISRAMVASALSSQKKPPSEPEDAKNDNKKSAQTKSFSNSSFFSGKTGKVSPEGWEIRPGLDLNAKQRDNEVRRELGLVFRPRPKEAVVPNSVALRLVELIDEIVINVARVEQIEQYFPQYRQYKNVDDDGFFHAIAKSGNPKYLELVFIAAKSDKFDFSDEQLAKALTEPNAFGATPFYYIVASGHEHLLEMIYEHFFEYFKGRRSTKIPPLHGRYAGGILHDLYYAAALPTNCGVTPLLAAINTGDTDIAAFLLEHFNVSGTELTHPQRRSRALADSALSAALRRGNAQFADLLLRHYESLLMQLPEDERKEFEDELCCVYSYGSRLIKDKSVDQKLHRFDHLNVLHLAAALDDKKLFVNLFSELSKYGLVRLIPDAKGNIRFSDVLMQHRSWMHDHSGTPLHSAASAGSAGVIQFIIDNRLNHPSLPFCQFEYDSDDVEYKDREICAQEYFNLPTTGGRIALDIAYRVLRLIRREYETLGQEDEEIRQLLVRCEAPYKLAYEELKKVYMDYSYEDKEKIREEVIRVLGGGKSTGLRIDLTHADSPWQFIRALDERLFVGEGAEAFIARIMGIFRIDPCLFWLKKAIYAARTADLEAFKYSLFKMKNYDISDSYGFTALHWAAYIGCIEWVHRLVQSRYDTRSMRTKLPPDIKVSREQLDPNRHYSGSTSLFEAVYFGHDPVIRALDSYGADFENARGLTQSSPLHILIWTRNVKLAIEIIRRGEVDLNAQNRLKRSMLYLAVELLVDELSFHGLGRYKAELRRRAQAHQKSKSGIMRKLEEKDQQFADNVLELIELLIERGASPFILAHPAKGLSRLSSTEEFGLDNASSNGESALHLAARIPEEFDKKGRRLPMEQQTCVKVGRLLMRAKHRKPESSRGDDKNENTSTSLSQLNSEGLSAAHIAAQRGNLSFLQFLINQHSGLLRKRPILLRKRSADGYLPIDLVEPQNQECIDLLRNVMTASGFLRGEDMSSREESDAVNKVGRGPGVR